VAESLPPLQFSAVFVTVLAVLGSAAGQNDIDILNFVLNVECLEAAFYTCAAYGVELSEAYLGAPSLHSLSVRCRRVAHTTI